MKVKIYVEGGGDSDTLRTRCRQGFRRFFERAGLSGRMPKVVACGSRGDAFDKFRTATAHGGDGSLPILLVDSETAVTQETCWKHLQERDGWETPDGATEEQVHLMVRCMEAWFLADRERLATYFGTKFGRTALPAASNVETIDKDVLLDKLKVASKPTKKGTYAKGKHSFQILEDLDPNKIAQASRHAKQLLDVLEKYCR